MIYDEEKEQREARKREETNKRAKLLAERKAREAQRLGITRPCPLLVKKGDA